MKLKILLPYKVFLDEEDVKKIVAEGGEGSFGLLPRHQDFVSLLVPGLLSYMDASGREIFVAVNGGTLVKAGEEVLVSTRGALKGPDLGQLRAAITSEFRTLDESERKARSALARLEADFVRRFMEFSEKK
ncbi:MAG: F0F1 ATP synthase subunit epsilon [Nitrospiraceae bacterium]|nr:F0F1 ATP synthase subunit epsilon [Nitrospiraceae bacterium]